MRVVVDFQDESLEIELREEQLVGAWNGPVGDDGAAVAAAVRSALENPREFPPLRQMVVPGDRVAIALDASIGGAEQVLEALLSVLQGAGIEDGSVTVLLPAPGTFAIEGRLPPGAVPIVHDSTDRTAIAYLATTKQGRRVYLSRHLTDADVVIPVGRLGYDPILGYRGPWSVLFPGMSDADTISSHRGLVRDESGHDVESPASRGPRRIVRGELVARQPVSRRNPSRRPRDRRSRRRP